MQELGTRARLTEGVVDADLLERRRALLAQDVGNGAAQATDHRVLLDGHDVAGLGGALDDQVGIDGLDGVHVDDLGVDALGSELLGGLESLADHQAAGDDGHIGALAHDNALTQLELVGLGVVDNRRGQTGEAHVHGAVALVGGARHGTGLHIVGGNDHGHAGDDAHEGDILAALVRGTVLAHRNTGVRGTDLNVKVRIADGVADLLKGAAGGKHGKAARKGDAAGGCDTGGNTHQVALGDAHIEEAVGAGGLKLAGLRGGGQVGVEDHKVIVLIGELDEGLAVAYARGDFLDVCHPRAPLRRP